ncbi:serine/threonine protein kinase [Chthoniobacter flavus Ellin428]|uniref:Serine/threonine protein kinase n=1 Tax=Chthoniobacter flavus Ellin428 TaxID=497964 RepID=B4D256_9BACT|nr:protein kinase [Chthoniobacter flavus]EDY19296.1 serine/threonine protein kinase [Chthoniobacter flavus Ellin428]TCO90571.1 serine/threonine protein kinase [Chthoniobacter flavus]
MNESIPKCPRCGAVLPANAPEGLCPRCLAALPFGTETAVTEEPKRPVQPPLSPEELAPHFPQLEIFECLGRGGMGVVYKARQKSLNRLVALKLLAPERADDPQFAVRFEKEAQALAALNHPNIVGVYDFGQAGGFYYLLMEFVDGVNLRQLLQTRRLAPKEALSIVPPVCDALQFAHEHGIVHRDIKPENLLLDKTGRVKIADFGIAKIIAASPGEHSTGKKGASTGTATLTVGTPAYAAPEQREANGEADHRADIYSLGVVLYEMLTGERPKDKFELPSKRVQIDVRIDDIVLRALQDAPERRYQSAAEFRTQVETIAHSTGATNEGTAEATALRAVHAWLELFDRGEYAATWDVTSTWFRREVTKENWTAKVLSVRPPLGDLVSREILDTRFVAGGSRFQVRFKTAFAGMPEATETVNFMRERDGAWKATGYLIRPADYEERRYPRLAALGAWWALLLPVSFILIFLLRSHAMNPATPGRLILLLVPIILAGLAAPIATTLLGWVAAVRLRRANGQRRGLGLAVFDGLLFPLLIVNVAIGIFWYSVTAFVVAWVHSRGWHPTDPRALDYVLIAGCGLVTVITSAWADWHIARRVWHAVQRRPDSPPAEPPVAARNTPLSTAALSCTWASGILTGITWILMPRPPEFVLWSILITALAGLALAIPSLRTPHGKWSLGFCACIVLAWVFLWKLLTSDTAPLAATIEPAEPSVPKAANPAESAPADANSLAQPPALRFLAWQEKDSSAPLWTRAWHPDGSPVIRADEIALLKLKLFHVPSVEERPDPQGRRPRFLNIWFSHPDFDMASSFQDIALRDEQGQPLVGVKTGFSRAWLSATPETQNVGWIGCAISPGWSSDVPARVTVRLNYVVGSLENTEAIEPDFNGGMPLEGSSQLGGIGQNAEGNAFVTVAVNAAQLKSRKFGALVVAKDGRRLLPTDYYTVPGGVLEMENFQFPVSLAQVANFVVGTRPIRTEEWKDVVLWPTKDAPVATPPRK